MLIKLTVETTLNTKLNEHLGYEKNSAKTGSNTRNGYSSKILLTDSEFEGSFEPQQIRKNQTHITQIGSQIYPSMQKG
ncbi:Uncharacterised protein [Providencia rettgeri]|nr:hypothetical protein [Providencia rettgeri]CAB5577008.1 Uncharacterised protein [Providencia rettgeri]CAC9130269.1 Uncharacterised protein [Providencia rettgeri]